jgi:NTE family protein
MCFPGAIPEGSFRISSFPYGIAKINSPLYEKDMARKKIGLALSGGGARGFAHVGVLRVLVENGIPIDMIAGTSAGSIVGGCFAAGMSMEQIGAMSALIRYSSIMLPTIGIGGMFSNAPMGNLLSKSLPVKNIEDTNMPFAAVAFDLATSEMVVLKRGDLVTAIRASCAVPGVFAPVRKGDGQVLVDGGVVSPLPVNIVREMGADIVIGIDLLSCGASFRVNSRTSLGIMLQSTMRLLQVAAESEHRNADIILQPEIAHLRPDQIHRRDEFIRLGEEVARDKLDEIKDLIG